MNDVETKIYKLSQVKNKKCEVDTVHVHSEYKCRECEDSFNNRSLLRKHIVHLHTKNVKCENCFLEFSENWKLEEHMAIHTDQKSFACDLCDKRFVLKWRLKKHMNAHNQRNIKFCHFSITTKFAISMKLVDVCSDTMMHQSANILIKADINCASSNMIHLMLFIITQIRRNTHVTHVVWCSLH